MRAIHMRALFLTPLLSLVAVAGCGDESNQLAAKGGFCDQLMALDQAFLESQEQPEEATPDELVSLAREEARRYQPILDRLVATAPSSVVTEVRTLQAEMAKMAQTGDESFLDGPGYGEVNGAIHLAAHDGCGYQNVTMTGSDYAFAGIPEVLDDRTTTFLLRNHSSSGEAHVAVIARMKDGVGESATQLAREGEAAFEKLEFPPIGGAYAPPAQVGGLIVDLKPGRYYVFCDIPTAGRADGEPHSAHGMVAAFTVK